MRAVILAAGEGKRMRPLTANMSKCMLPVAGVPIVERLVLSLKSAGMRGATIVVGYKEERIREHFGDGRKWDVSIDYVVQKEQLGTGHALAQIPETVGRFMVANGDILVDAASVKAIASHPGFAVAGVTVKDPTEYGTFRLSGKTIQEIVEKSTTPPSSHANAGLYMIDSTVLEAARSLSKTERGEFEIVDAVNAAIAKGARFEMVDMREWRDVGRPWHLLEANEEAMREVKTRLNGTVEKGATLKGAVQVGKGAVVRAGAYIEGPVIIGANCTVGPNCYIRPGTVLMEGAKVGNGCEVKNSIIMANAHVNHLSYVGDSIIGERVNLGAGTKVANLRHDGKTIKAKWDGQKFDTGRRKFGVVLGDDVHTGINTSLNVGVMLAAKAATRPGDVVL
ncbi:MAG: NTP transferase domain-containing protein [Euryarchaeota archaeon]|nr:NTP transferase domain-containing protein [Euryarchaeota archaeon]